MLGDIARIYDTGVGKGWEVVPGSGKKGEWERADKGSGAEGSWRVSVAGFSSMTGLLLQTTFQAIVRACH